MLGTAPTSTFRSPLHTRRGKHGSNASAVLFTDSIIGQQTVMYVCAVRCAPDTHPPLCTATPTLCAQLHRPAPHTQRRKHDIHLGSTHPADARTNTILTHTSCLRYREHIVSHHRTTSVRHQVPLHRSLLNAPAAPPERHPDITTTGWAGEREYDLGAHMTSIRLQTLRQHAREGGSRAPRRARVTQHRQRAAPKCVDFISSQRRAHSSELANTAAPRRHRYHRERPWRCAFRCVVSNETTALLNALLTSSTSSAACRDHGDERSA
jgi:hypothetical protein